jgi:hypothetical protein
MPTGVYYYENIDGSTVLNPQAALDYSARNAYRLPPFHKLDLNFIRKFTWFDLPFQLSLNIYNAYNRQNPFGQTVNFSYASSFNPSTGQYSFQPVPQVTQYTLFPLIPTVGLSVDF